MTVLLIAWLIVNSVLGVWLAWTALIDRILLALIWLLRSRFTFSHDAVHFVTLGVLAVVHGTLAVVLGLLVSIGIAIITTAIAGVIWALLGYFLLQRFAGPLDRIPLVRDAP